MIVLGPKAKDVYNAIMSSPKESNKGKRRKRLEEFTKQLKESKMKKKQRA